MAIRLAALGPPGTGKTTFSLALVNEWVAHGVPTQRIGCLAFTKAAANEAASRVAGGDFDMEAYPWFRTIHSLCYRLMREDKSAGRPLLAGDMRKFSKESGLQGEYSVQSSDDLAEVYQALQVTGKSVWDHCLTAYTLSRISCRTEAELDRARVQISDSAVRRMGWADPDAYRAFVQKYEAYKKANGLIDFTDMLEHPIRNACSVPVRNVIVDECQDLCPLHFAIIDRLFGDNADELWYIGDDDQAIFGFSGASAEEFLREIEPARKVVLRQTHRFGQEIVDLSAQIIRRVKTRIEKDVIGKAGAESIIAVTGQLKPSADPGFILHRHVAGCRALADRFISFGIPFRNERGRSPLSSESRLKAFKTLSTLADGGKVRVGSAAVLIEDLVPTHWIDKDGVKVRLVVHGAKTKIVKSPSPAAEVTLNDLADGILTEAGIRVIRERQVEILKHASDLSYYARVLKAGYHLEPAGPTITTIHASKGREADRVTVFSESGRKCWDDPDNEHRLAYVASTRTRRELTVCRERLLDWAIVDYEYPVLTPA